MVQSEDTSTIVSTPILDSGTLPPAVRSKKISRLRAILAFVAGCIFTLPIIAWTDKSRDPTIGFFLLISALALTITVHELGHIFAGWLVGFRFNFINLGPLSLSFEQGTLRVRFRQDTTVLGSAGMHAGTVRRLHRRLLTFIAGGPAANLLSIPITVLLVNRVFPGLGETRVGTLAAQFTVFSILTAMVSLMPMRSGIMSDGARIEMLFRSRDRSRRWLSIAALGNFHDNGIRARDWKRTWLQSASSICDRSRDAFIGDWLAYMSANDRKDATIAALHLERCLESVGGLPLSARDVVAQEAAVFTAWFRDNVAVADKWVTQVRKPQKMQPLVRIRLDAALSWAHRDYDAVDLAWRTGLAFIEKATAGTARERLKESWLEWQAEIQDRKAQLVAVSSAAN